MTVTAPVLDGKVALVTGGSRGLGRAIAIAFAQAGADVIIASRKLDSVERAAAEIADETGRKVTGFAAHVGDWAQCTELIDKSVALSGKLDVLVNNAGIAPLYPHLHEATEELFDKTLAVNLKGPLRLGALAAHHMADGGGGSIINISSVAAIRPTQHEVRTAPPRPACTW